MEESIEFFNKFSNVTFIRPRKLTDQMFENIWILEKHVGESVGHLSYIHALIFKKKIDFYTTRQFSEKLRRKLQRFLLQTVKYLIPIKAFVKHFYL